MTIPPLSPKKLRQRDTPDLIVLWLAGIIGFVIIATTSAILIAALTDSNVNVAKVAQNMSDLTTSLIAAVVGYLAGRGVYVTPPDNPTPPNPEEDPNGPISGPRTAVPRPRKR